MTKLSFDETLIEVWRQALVENSSAVKVGGESYPVRRTPKLGLREVDFTFDGDEIRGLEQNPGTKSRWAQLARSGKKVVPQRRAIRGKRGRWEGDALRQSTVIFNGIECEAQKSFCLRFVTQLPPPALTLFCRSIQLRTELNPRGHPKRFRRAVHASV